jgi:predicted ribosomally synthesized peptide with SipW-like signal peptide
MDGIVTAAVISVVVVATTYSYWSSTKLGDGPIGDDPDAEDREAS